MMKKRSNVDGIACSVIVMFFVTAMICSLGVLTSAWAGDKFLADRHMDRGLKCSDCHKQDPPDQFVYKEDCLKCHGPGYETLKKRTSNVVVNGVKRNPHAGHDGTLNCDSCHHAHKAPEEDPEAACGACHNVGFSKVP